MFVVERIEVIIIVINVHLFSVMKILEPFPNQWLWKSIEFKDFYIHFFTERDGWNSCFWLQFIEMGVTFDIRNEFLFLNT